MVCSVFRPNDFKIRVEKVEKPPDAQDENSVKIMRR
jgi:hypothetical protein